MEIASVFIAAFVIMLASLSGKLFVWNAASNWFNRNLRYLVTFSAGVFIIASYGLFEESFNFGGTTVTILLGAALGAAVLEFVTWLVPQTHHHHDIEHDHTHSRTDARRVLIGDAVHNVADGILLVPTFLIDIRFGIATTLAVFLHEIVQEVSEFFILREAGYSTTRALVLNFSVSSTILIGVGIGLFAADVSVLVPMLLAFAAGAFLYVIFRDLLPGTIRSIVRKNEMGKHLIAGVLGVLAMFGVSALAPHSHTDETPDEHATEMHDESVNK